MHYLPHALCYHNAPLTAPLPPLRLRLLLLPAPPSPLLLLLLFLLRLLLTPHVFPEAYGARGFPAWGIPANSDLTFEIQVPTIESASSSS